MYANVFLAKDHCFPMLPPILASDWKRSVIKFFVGIAETNDTLLGDFIIGVEGLSGFSTDK